MLRAFGISDKGRVRPTNEDCFAIDEALGLCVVADGLGGHNAGEVAARMAVDAVVDHVRVVEAAPPIVEAERDASASRWPFGFDQALSIDGNVLRTAVLVADLQILEAAVGTAPYSGMGTTVVAARVLGGRLIVAHVGDSRLYRFGAGGLAQITDDDSWVATVLAREPGVDRAALAHHPMRNALTNVVGSRGRTEVHVVEQDLASGDLLLLTTDGVHGVLDDGKLTRIVGSGMPLNAIAEDVIAAALRHGSRDNVTALVARYTA